MSFACQRGSATWQEFLKQHILVFRTIVEGKFPDFMPVEVGLDVAHNIERPHAPRVRLRVEIVNVNYRAEAGRLTSTPQRVRPLGPGCIDC